MYTSDLTSRHNLTAEQRALRRFQLRKMNGQLKPSNIGQVSEIVRKRNQPITVKPARFNTNGKSSNRAVKNGKR